MGESKGHQKKQRFHEQNEPLSNNCPTTAEEQLARAKLVHSARRKRLPRGIEKQTWLLIVYIKVGLGHFLMKRQYWILAGHFHAISERMVDKRALSMMLLRGQKWLLVRS